MTNQDQLEQELAFERARAYIMEICDCGISYWNLKWVLDYVKDNELNGYPNYLNAKDYIEEALNSTLEELEWVDLETKEKIKEGLKSEGLFYSVGNKMLEDAREDFRGIGLMLDGVEIRSDGRSVFFTQGNFEKECFIEEFEENDNPLKSEFVEKHKVLFEALELLDELKQEKSKDEIMETRFRKQNKF